MSYWISIVTEACIFSIMALGLNVIWGWAGDFDLALYGYVALGVYLTIAMTTGPPVAPTEYILGWQLPYLLAALLAVVIVLAVLTFVQTRHLYPSQPGRLNRLATLLGVPWTFLFVWLIWELPREANARFDTTTMQWAWISLSYPLFYLGVSLAISVAHWRKRLMRV